MEKYNVKRCEMCICNNCERLEDMGVECLTNAMLQSPEGRKLEKQHRWGDWRWDDTKRFEQHLGPDVNNFWHGPYQAKEVAIPFIEHQNAYGVRKIDEADARLLVALNCLHDIQEAHTGDIPLPDRTAEGNAHELRLQREIIARILGVTPHDPFIERLQEVQSGVNFLSRAFKAIEYCGYFNTALRAWALKDHEGLEPEEREKCFALGQAVLTINTPKMARMVEFPFVQDLLLKNQAAIEAAHGL